MRKKRTISRRNFLTIASASAAGYTVAGTRPVSAVSASKVVGANDTIRLGVIGCGDRGRRLTVKAYERIEKMGAKARIVAVCDIYEPRKLQAKEQTGADLHHHWEELIERPDIDGVFIATPNHWHAPMSIAAMEAGKDIYCEKPMTKTVGEAKAVHDTAVKTGRIVQIGANHTSEGQWFTARDIVRDGKIGKVIWSQRSYCSNSVTGRWNTPIDMDASPDNLDWNAFLGNAPKRPFNRERYFRWRKYWDYGGGIASDWNYHKLAEVLVVLGVEFPERVSVAGGHYVREDLEVPDTTITTIEYPSGHVVVLASTMVNRNGLSAVVRGHYASIECELDKVTVTTEPEFAEKFEENFGQPESIEIKPMEVRDHMLNWFDGIRTREKCVVNEDHGYKTMVAIAMQVEAFKTGKTLCWDAESHKIVDGGPRAPHPHENELA